MEKFKTTLATAGGKEILAVIENLPVSANGFFLTESQMSNIESALATAATNATALKTAQDGLAAAVSAKETAEASLQTANARIATLEKQDAVIPSAAHAAEDIKPAGSDANAFETSYDRELAQLQAMYK